MGTSVGQLDEVVENAEQTDFWCTAAGQICVEALVEALHDCCIVWSPGQTSEMVP